MQYRTLLAAMALVLTSTLAAAAPELHAVGVHDGNIRTDGRVHGPEVALTVDRPGIEVTLALGSDRPVRWRVVATAGTRIARVVLHGRANERSEVLVNGTAPDTLELLADIEAIHETAGPRFLGYRQTLPDRLGFARIDSFHGRYLASERGFTVDRPNPIAPDPLATEVQPDALPPALRQALDTPRAEVRFTETGFALKTPHGIEATFPITLDVPGVSRPVAGAFDPVGGRLFGVTRGGEGFVYQYDMAQDRWSILTHMNYADATGMIYDPEQNRLIVGLGAPNPGLVMVPLDGNAPERVSLDPAALPGLTDLYIPEAWRAPDLRPAAVAGDVLYLVAGPERAIESSARRGYVIHMPTGLARLIDYEDAIN